MKPIFKKRRILVMIIGLLLVLSLNFFQKEVKGFFYAISAPAQKSLWQAGSEASNFFEAIFEAKNLKEENKNLKLKIQELLSEQNSLEELKRENRELREALDLGLQKEFKLASARIIGKDIGRDSILIDRGLKDGIKEGLLVITSQKVLIGKVTESYQDYSRVLLLSDKNSSLEVQISGANTFGLVKGQGGFNIFLDLIPNEEQMKEGDLIVYREFLIGLVGKINKIDVSPFQQAGIAPFFDISNLDRVLIILGF